MCGNAIRCIAKYVYDHGLTDQTQISIETKAGVKYLDLTVKDGKTELVKVNMGAPVLEPEKIPVKLGKERCIREKLTVEGKEYEVTAVSMGNPHLVVETEDPYALDLEKIGPVFEKDPRFPEGVNTEFICMEGKTDIRMRVWERGSGETMACGTGSCASAAAMIRCGKAADTVTVHLTGGDLQIEWDREKDRIFMTGPAVTVYEGELIDTGRFGTLV